MAVSATNIATSGDNVDRTSYSTASITPGSNNLILAWVYSIAAAAPNTPTASGNGLTWVEIDNQIDSSNLRKITLFRAMGASPSAGAVTFDFAGQTQTGCGWSVVEYTGMDTSGTNGSGAIVQSAKNASAGNATSLTVTLASFGSANNATAGGFGIPLNTANLPAEGSGFTDTGQRNQSTPNLAIGSEFLASNDTSVDMTSSSSSIPWTGIAVEIKQAVVDTSVTPSTASITITKYAPTVSTTDNKSVTPSLASLTITKYAPTVSVSDNQSVTPSLATLTLSSFAPTVTTSDNKSVTPSLSTLSLSTFAPVISTSNNQIVTPDLATLTLSTYAPVVSYSDNQTTTPGTASLTLSTYSPTVNVANPGTVEPATASLTLTTYRPTVRRSIYPPDFYIDSDGNVYLVIDQNLALVEKI